MSYILDALKKSEQQRQQNNHHRTAGAGWLGSHGDSDGDSESGKPASSLLPGLLLGVVVSVVVSVTIAYWYFPQSNESVEPQQAVSMNDEYQAAVVQTEMIEGMSVDPVIVPVLVSKTDQSSSAPQKHPEDPKPAEKAMLEQTAPEKTPHEYKSPDSVVQQVQRSKRQLPPLDVLKKVPDLIITGHIYSSVADKRSVSMNGYDWQEGDLIAPGLTLSDITPDGIIVDIDGWSLPVKRNRGWQAID